MRLPVLFILITVMIDAMGIGLILPVMPDLIRETTGGTLAQAAIWGGILSTAFAAMQFLFGPILGGLSDRFGRRPVLLVSLLVMAADYVVMALAGSIWLLLAGRIVGGITAATHSTASAYMADISAPHEKARNFGLIGAAFGMGFVLGPVMGGLLAEWGTRAPFIAAALLALANAAFGWLVLRETVTDRIRRPFQWGRANPFGAIRAVSKLGGVGSLIWVYFLYHFATVVYPAIWAYFTAARFGWSPGLIGVSLAVYGLSLAVAQGTLVGPAIRLFGDARTVLLGLLIQIISLVILGFIASGNLLLMLIPVTAIGAIGLPALQGILSRAVADNAQGELQGVLTSLTSVAMVVAPLVMTQTFAQFTRADAGLYLPGAPFLLSAVIMTLAAVIYQMRGRQITG
ncbi:MAG: TCR/Tet family MFS transporter [Paracoccaceae bacterium]|uniref:TCR/Tet family MFS transporter n=1 Tax=unclassified Seohaeicola TaxID=2641111 RepID=UPI00237A3B29|nr:MULTISPECIES: TCR/Tet family MFS transporter [unclassified Seohaeicola]MDD9706536.1 TCR/Tet family MFS transporter [Seohaeicola sp. 4SK31]MDD9737258.1 TCR/Tet family MFS transporter [Seohaeicola sp. SP36]